MNQSSELEALMVRMLNAAGKCASAARLDSAWKKKVSERASLISKCAARSRLNVILFHQTVPKQASIISTPDIRHLDLCAVDYEALIRLNIEVALWSNPDCRIHLFTDRFFVSQWKCQSRLSITRLDVTPAEPMFERVLTMAAYTQSAAFTAPTVFLDSDAFLVRPISSIFSNDFDLGVTYRDNPGMMPINEGVIFANDKNPVATQKFFERYLATYLGLEQSVDVLNVYGDIRRWRGGQLSINGVSGALPRYSRGIKTSKEECARIAYLPCSQYNLSDVSKSEIDDSLIDRCSIVHLKGNRKSWLDQLTETLRCLGFHAILKK